MLVVTTLIAVWTAGGCAGSCDARCYTAVGEECECICGGVNHAAGLAQAASNTRELAQARTAQALADGQDVLRIELAPAVTCQPLFG